MEHLARHLERIRAYRPDLAHVTVQVSSEGQVNDVVIFGGEWVARFPKNDWARQRLAQEARILDLVRRHVSLPVPVFEHPADDFVMYRLLPGAALTQREILGQAERVQAQIV